jgi:sterol desaturase/sphingolipid hydroxylase (fatty acid hydroxylase superfamily)
MISFKSIINFFSINGFLVSLTYIKYLFIKLLQINIYFKFLITYLTFVFRNYFIIFFITKSSAHKEKINTKLPPPKEEYKGEFHVNLLTATFIETITFHLGKLLVNSSTNVFWDLVYFIPVSFIFEVIFDFFHYWTHYIAHRYKTLYTFIHKKHHKFPNPIAITTFYQEPIDLFLTNSFPTLMSLFLTTFMFNISPFSLALFLTYKNFIEICGHTGYVSYPTPSFPQFIWLPKLLGIELYTESHDYHHSLNNCNYSKRFALWDRVFGTFFIK